MVVLRRPGHSTLSAPPHSVASPQPSGARRNEVVVLHVGSETMEGGVYILGHMTVGLNGAHASCKNSADVDV